MKEGLFVFWGWFIASLWRRSSITTTVMRFVCCAVTALSLLGCAVNYSNEALHAMAPGVEIVDVCVRMPARKNYWVVLAFNAQSRKATTNRDGDEFERAAKTADVIYRFDPNAPEDSPLRLPWPYNKMTCHELSALKTPSMPDGMQKIPISSDAREALMAALLDRSPSDLRNTETSTAARAANKQWLGWGSSMGAAPIKPPTTERLKQGIDEVGQIMRDAIRSVLPQVPTPNDGQISIIDTNAGQVIGGLGAGTAISWVPGGVFIADAMQSSDQVPKPTPQFSVGQNLAQMGSGILQIGGGGTLAAGGVTMSATGVGAVAGIPTCTAGVMLAANGTITLLHGTHGLLIAICNWHELDDAKPLAAVAPKDTTQSAPPPQTNVATTSVTTPAAKPSPAPVQAAKPTTAPAKPGAKPEAKPAPQAAPAKPVQPAKPAATESRTVTRDKKTGQVVKAQETTKPQGKPANPAASPLGKPPAGDAAKPVPKQRGGDSPAAARGRQVHEEFKQKVLAKKEKEPGWQEKPKVTDPVTKKELRPDALTPEGHPIELKPNTPSGRAAGARQIKKYEAATKKKGRVLYYDP
jgi:hypothetical protein